MPVPCTNNARLCPRCACCSSVPHTSHQTINNALKPPPLTHKIQNTQAGVGFESISKTAAANISYAVAALHRSCQTCQFRKEIKKQRQGRLTRFRISKLLFDSSPSPRPQEPSSPMSLLRCLQIVTAPTTQKQIQKKYHQIQLLQAAV